MNINTNKMTTTDYEHVWQYGSMPNSPTPWESDGIAPQCDDQINGLPRVNKIYLEDYKLETKHMRNFLDAHYNEKYVWIFGITEIKGKVDERN